MIAITIPYWGKCPDWWDRFEETVKFPAGYDDLNSKQSRPVWRSSVNNELMKYGGRLQPSYMSSQKCHDLLVTFRLDSNYTYFLLKFS